MLSKRNLLIIFTGTVATTLASKVVESFQKDYKVTAVLTEKSKYFLNYGTVIASNCGVVPNPICEVKDDATEWDGFPVGGYRYNKENKIPHIELAKENDVLLIISSADFMGKMVNGLCDDLASSVYRAWHRYKPVIVAPAMNTHMWEHPITEKHLDILKSWNVRIVYPIAKKLACGVVGMGALEDIYEIKQHVDSYLRIDTPLAQYNGIPIRNHPGSFLFKRKYGKHTGVDLYTNDGAPVFAMAMGKIISIEEFTGKADNSDWWEDTQCILVEHWFGVMCYGEIVVRKNLKVGDYVLSGHILGNVKRVLKPGKERLDISGHSTSMLHIELYKNGQQKASNTYLKDKDILKDPTPYLIQADRSAILLT